jgi:hypothetical protein
VQPSVKSNLACTALASSRVRVANETPKHAPDTQTHPSCHARRRERRRQAHPGEGAGARRLALWTTSPLTSTSTPPPPHRSQSLFSSSLRLLI